MSQRECQVIDAKSILYVAYPLATVSDESCGGAEQMLWVVEREMASRGYRTTVAACSHSRVSGELLDTGAPALRFEQLAERDSVHNGHVFRRLRERRATGSGINLVHDEGGRFWPHAGMTDTPVLATLNLPRSFYPEGAFEEVPSNVYFNCVSFHQSRSFAGLPRMLGVVRNGIPLERFPYTSRKEGYLVWLGRICEEKGLHTAVEVSKRARMPLVILGPSYLYARDQAYFDTCVAPRLNSDCKLVGSPSFAEKIAILRHARALLMPSTLAETSSLVCLEAMACGTPAIAFRNGALPEVIVDGYTGFITDTTEEMVEAVDRVQRLRPAACRVHVERNHSAAAMADAYEEFYRTLASDSRQVPNFSGVAQAAASSALGD